MLCNYSCSYCTAYTKYNSPIKAKEYKQLSADKWLKVLNDDRIYENYQEGFQIIISGGEPALYSNFKALCDGLKNRNVCVYSNISEKAHKVLLTLEKPIKIYPSFNNVIERQRHGENAFKLWYQRLYEIGQKGHLFYTAHSPNDFSEGLKDIPDIILKTKIEGYFNHKYYNPHVNEIRIKAAHMRKVKCCTLQFCIASDGSIYNCQAGLWGKIDKLKIGNISDTNLWDIPDWFDCDQCGACHICSQGKVITELDGTIIKDNWQFLPILDELKNGR